MLEGGGMFMFRRPAVWPQMFAPAFSLERRHLANSFSATWTCYLIIIPASIFNPTRARMASFGIWSVVTSEQLTKDTPSWVAKCRLEAHGMIGEGVVVELTSALQRSASPPAVSTEPSRQRIVQPAARRRSWNCGRSFSPTRVNPTARAGCLP